MTLTDSDDQTPRRPLWHTERQLKSKHPHVIVHGTFKMHSRFGGEVQEIDMTLPLYGFLRLRGRH